MDWLNRLGEFADQHVREIGYVKYAVGIFGIGLIVRHTHLSKKLCSLADIPPQFIKKHTRLQGIVRQVEPSGVLHVDHIPVLSIKWFYKNEGLLPVSLCGVAVHNDGVQYLQDTVQNKHVWFKLVGIQDKTSVDCIVKFRKNYIASVNLNEHLVACGLASVKPLDKLVKDNLQTKFVNQLLKAELKAEKNGKGMWVKPSVRERLRSYGDEKISNAKANVSNTADYVKKKIPFYQYFTDRRLKGRKLDKEKSEPPRQS